MEREKELTSDREKGDDWGRRRSPEKSRNEERGGKRGGERCMRDRSSTFLK